MPNFETADEIAEQLADWLYIYADPRCDEPAQDWTCPSAECEDGEPSDHCHIGSPPFGYDVLHVEDCNCRLFWVPAMADRIRAAVQNEWRLARLASIEVTDLVS